MRWTGIAFAAYALTASAQEVPPATWADYQAAHSLECVGPAERIEPPQVVEHGGWHYAFAGSSVQIRRLAGGRRGEVRLGVISGIKDADPETKTAVDGFLIRFRKDDVDAILVGGDTAEREEDLETIFGWLAAPGVPVLAVAGNWESRSAFNRALATVSKDHPNAVNMDLARRADGEGFDVIALGGYRDKAYVKQTAACFYKAEDAQALPALAAACDDPVVLLMHAPPRQAGKEAIDFVPGSGNVGDPDVAAALARAEIRFGVHGHILEGGGRATDARGHRLPEGRLYKELFLNPGAANPLPWKLNDGRTAHGLAAILTLKGAGARYEVLRAGK